MVFGIKDNFKQISYLTMLLSKIAKKKKSLESLLITNLTSPRILLALQKRQI